MKSKSFIPLLLAALALMSCTAEDKAGSSCTPLDISVGLNRARAVIEDATLPDGSSIGLALRDASGSTYDGTSYANVRYTATGSGSSQTWSTASDIMLSTTEGTLYGYYPYSSAVTNITAVPVETASQTDYMYATPVTGVDMADNMPSVVMNHALAVIRLSIVRGTYSGTGNITSIQYLGDNMAASATMDATDGTLSAVTGAGTAVTTDVSVTLGNSALTVDRLFVPVDGVSAAPAFLLTIDGQTFTAQPTATEFAPNSIYKYTLTVNDNTIGVSAVNVAGWTGNDRGGLSIQGEYNVNIAGDLTGIGLNYEIQEDGTVRIDAIPFEGGQVIADVTCSDGADITTTVDANGHVTYLLSNFTGDVTITFNGVHDGVLVVDFQSNQGDADTSLSGVKATVSFDGTTVELADGENVGVPLNTSVTITWPAVTGYSTPATDTFTHTGGKITRTGSYNTEIVSVTLSANDDASVSGQTVTINGTAYTWGGTTVEHKVPYGTQYTVSVSDKSGYITPAAQTFTASQSARNLSMVYDSQNLIEFAIDGTTYNCIVGTTWAEWSESAFKYQDKITEAGTYISVGYWYCSDTVNLIVGQTMDGVVNSTDVIQEGGAYKQIILTAVEMPV